jgi:hypothetical protein
MFFGPLRPLSPDVHLCELLDEIGHGVRLGAWVSGCSPGQRVYRTQGRPTSLLLSPDLGFLLQRCSRIVLRQGGKPSTLQAETIIQWRALQVATATPWLPGYEKLAALFPGTELQEGGLLIPLGGRSPEQILVECLASGMRVIRSNIVYDGRA